MSLKGSAREVITDVFSDWWAFTCLKTYYFKPSQFEEYVKKGGGKEEEEEEPVAENVTNSVFEGSDYEKLFRKTSNVKDGRHFSRRYHRGAKFLDPASMKVVQLLEFVIAYHVNVVIMEASRSTFSGKEAKFAVWEHFRAEGPIGSLYRLFSLLYSDEQYNLTKKYVKTTDDERSEDVKETFENRFDIAYKKTDILRLCQNHQRYVRRSISKRVKNPLFMGVSIMNDRSKLVRFLLDGIKERQSTTLERPISYPCVGNFGFENVVSLSSSSSSFLHGDDGEEEEEGGEEEEEEYDIYSLCDVKYFSIIKLFLTALDGYRPSVEILSESQGLRKYR